MKKLIVAMFCAALSLNAAANSNVSWKHFLPNLPVYSMAKSYNDLYLGIAGNTEGKNGVYSYNGTVFDYVNIVVDGRDISPYAYELQVNEGHNYQDVLRIATIGLLSNTDDAWHFTLNANSPLTCVFEDSADGNLFVGHASGNVSEKVANSKDWTSLKTFAPADTYITSMKRIGDDLYAGTHAAGNGNNAGLYVSHDNGATWNLVPIKTQYPVSDNPTPNINVVQFNSKNHTIYVGTDKYQGLHDHLGDVYASSDGGVHWKNIFDYGATVHDIFPYDDGEIVLVATGNGLWKSIDGGFSWKKQYLVGYDVSSIGIFDDKVIAGVSKNNLDKTQPLNGTGAYVTNLSDIL